MKSKRFLCTVLACVVMISCITNAAAIQEEVADDFVEYNTESILTTRAIGEFEMTVSAKTKAIADSSLVADENDYPADEYMNCNRRETTVPKKFYNIAINGIYKGSFGDLRGRMYTSKYFDTQDCEYYSRVRCYGEYPNLTYKAGNYCVTCKKVLSTSESDYYTPATPWQDGNWVSFHHTVESRHTDHFVCPFVINTSGLINDQLYAIGGDIWVNYTDTWS